jgi:hypothetical protein
MSLIEPNQVGVREDLSDEIAVADAKNTPLCTMAPKGAKPGNMLMSWQVDAEHDVSTAGTLDGTDATSFNDPAENRELLSVYAQWFTRDDKIGKLAEKVSNVAGVSAGEKARAVTKALINIKRNIEAKASSDDDTAAQSGATAYAMRGLGSYINNSAQGVQPIPAQYRTPTASIDSTTNTSSATESSINTVLESIFGQTGSEKDFDGICGKKMRSRISDLQLYDANASAGTAYIAARHINKDQKDATIAKKIDIVVGDFGTIKLHTSEFLGWSAGSKTQAVGDGRMYILDMKDIMLRFSQTPGVMELPDNGGGPRFRTDAICGLLVGNPLKHGAFKPTAN